MGLMPLGEDRSQRFAIRVARGAAAVLEVFVEPWQHRAIHELPAGKACEAPMIGCRDDETKPTGSSRAIRTTAIHSSVDSCVSRAAGAVEPKTVRVSAS